MSSLLLPVLRSRSAGLGRRGLFLAGRREQLWPRKRPISRCWTAPSSGPTGFGHLDLVRRSFSSQAPPPPPQSLYQVLGVSETADAQQIKRAFFEQSKLHHPDVHRGEAEKAAAEEQFRALAAAYEILSNTESRAEYDRDRVDRQQRVTWRPGHEDRDGDDGPEAPGRRDYGVHADWGRKVDVDLSPERMARAWEAYKLRWEKEEARRLELEEQKLQFRLDHDRQREEGYRNMSEEERETQREDMRLLRFPSKNNTNSKKENVSGNSATSASAEAKRAGNQAQATRISLDDLKDKSKPESSSESTRAKKPFNPFDSAAEDPLAVKPSSGADFFAETLKASRQSAQNVKEAWDTSEPFSHTTAGLHGDKSKYDAYRPNSVTIAPPSVYFMLAFAVFMVGVELFYNNSDMYASNAFLNELKKKEAADKKGNIVE